MTQDEAVSLAEALVFAAEKAATQLGAWTYAYRLSGARRSRDGSWLVAYEVFRPDEPDTIVDGPVVVVVTESGKARFLNDQ